MASSVSENNYSKKYYKDHPKYRKKKIEQRKEYAKDNKKSESDYSKSYYWDNEDYRKKKKQYAIEYKRTHKEKKKTK